MANSCNVALVLFRSQVNRGIAERVMDPTPIVTQTLTTSTSQVSSTAASTTANLLALASDDILMWRISPSMTAPTTNPGVWVKQAVSPTASAGNDFFVGNGQVLLLPAISGCKIAVIEAS